MLLLCYDLIKVQNWGDFLAGNRDYLAGNRDYLAGNRGLAGREHAWSPIYQCSTLYYGIVESTSVNSAV